MELTQIVQLNNREKARDMYNQYKKLLDQSDIS